MWHTKHYWYVLAMSDLVAEAMGGADWLAREHESEG
jgi:hypothetical protein